MPAQISEDVRRDIVRLRALDYTKAEIADELDISRNTVSRHLGEIREEIEAKQNPNFALAEFLFDPDELLPYFMEQSGDVLDDLDDGFRSFVKHQIGND